MPCPFSSPAGDTVEKKVDVRELTHEEQRKLPLSERIGALKGAPREAYVDVVCTPLAVAARWGTLLQDGREPSPNLVACDRRDSS